MVNSTGRAGWFHQHKRRSHLSHRSTHGPLQLLSADIKPRGVFMQNTFQHPAPPVMSALGVTIQRGRTSRNPYAPLQPGLTLSGLGCGSCGGRCSSSLSGPRRRRTFHGDDSDTHIDTNTGGVMDSDGNLLTLPCGPGGRQLQHRNVPRIVPTSQVHQIPDWCSSSSLPASKSCRQQQDRES